MTRRSTLLGSAAIITFASPAFAQQPAPTPTQAPTQQPADAPAAQLDSGAAQAAYDDYGDEEPIVIQGARARGSVIGDIPPENVLDSRDVRATGATSIDELLDALAPQIGSAQGRSAGRPVLLLNGQRISGFRELRDIPTEAIERMEILPEEVALKYGYRADQKVVNIVLRQRFRSTTARVDGTAATEGGYAGGAGDLTQFRVEKNGRTTLNAHVEGNGMLTEAERDILINPPASGTVEDALAARSLLGTKRDIRASGTFNRQIFGDVSATLNTEVEHTEGRSLIGLGETLLLPLARETSSDSAHAGGVLNGMKGQWRWTLTGNADLDRSRTSTDQDDPDTPSDRARETTRSGDLKATANGKLFSLPAGDASTTLTLGGSTVHLDSRRFSADDSSATSLGRSTGEAAINVDLPISRRNREFSALGNFTLNANAEVDRLSDFGTLTTLGAGANWSPVDRLSFVGSWSREEGPPSINQLGDPVLETPGTRIFDFTTGETVLVTAVTGGNPDLQADRRTVVKLGANWQPFEKTDLRLRAEYVHQTIANPISGLNVTETIEQAFPERFERDSSGQLIRADLRPVNFESSQRDSLRIGFDFSKPLKSRQPSQAVRDQLRAQFGGRPRSERTEGSANSTGAPPTTPPTEGAANPAGAPPTTPPAEGSAAAPSTEANAPPPEQGEFRGRGGRGGGRFGGGDRGRLTFSLTDTITFVDKVKIREGVPEIDYLHGDAAGQGGGTARHQVEARAGYFNNGLGARVNANWRSGTTVDTLSGDNLRFSPLATFDLRLFANPGDMPELAVKHPWLRGTQVQLRVDNIFNSRPKVHDAGGAVPLSYQPDLLDPLGRTIMISFRKLFLPSPSWFRRQFQEMRQGQSR
jgi:hypothetical protein